MALLIFGEASNEGDQKEMAKRAKDFIEKHTPDGAYSIRNVQDGTCLKGKKDPVLIEKIPVKILFYELTQCSEYNFKDYIVSLYNDRDWDMWYQSHPDWAKKFEDDNENEIEDSEEFYEFREKIGSEMKWMYDMKNHPLIIETLRCWDFFNTTIGTGVLECLRNGMGEEQIKNELSIYADHNCLLAKIYKKEIGKDKDFGKKWLNMVYEKPFLLSQVKIFIDNSEKLIEFWKIYNHILPSFRFRSYKEI